MPHVSTTFCARFQWFRSVPDDCYPVSCVPGDGAPGWKWDEWRDTVGLMVGSFMCSICITWKRVEGYEVSRSAWWDRYHWSSQTCDLFETRMWLELLPWISLPFFSFNLKINMPWKTCPFIDVIVTSKLSSRGAGMETLSFFPFCSDCHFLPELCDLEQATPCANIFVPVRLPRSWRRQVWTKVIQPSDLKQPTSHQVGWYKKVGGWKVHITPPLNQKWARNAISWCWSFKRMGESSPTSWQERLVISEPRGWR